MVSIIGSKPVFKADFVEKSGIAKIFMHGRSQAVRLPKEFRLPGKEVRVTHVGRGVLLEPVTTPPTHEEIQAWFAKLDSLGGADFLPEGRPEQPPMPDDDEIDFDRLDDE